MKKSFYELYLERQRINNDTKIIEQETPKIRSPSRNRVIVSYYLWQIAKSIFLIVICLLATIGCVSILKENIRSQIIELLFSSSFFDTLI